MELLQLRYFLTVAKLQHMTQAAQVLQIAQPALSQSIKRLEAELGVQLFDRKSRGIVLNEAGELLEKELLPIMTALAGLPARLKEADASRRHTIRLNLLAASSLVSNLVIEYKASHPDVMFQLSQHHIPGAYDLGIYAVLPGEKSLSHSKVLLEEAFYLAVPAVSPYARRASVRLEDVCSEGFISFSESKPIRSICDHFCLAAGFTPNIVFEGDNLNVVRNLIGAGFGIGFWPRYSWGNVNSSHVALLPIEHPVCRRQIVVTCNQQMLANPVINDFYQYLLSSRLTP